MKNLDSVLNRPTGIGTETRSELPTGGLRVFIGGYEISAIVDIKRVHVEDKGFGNTVTLEIETSKSKLEYRDPDGNELVLFLGEVPEADFLSKMVALRLGVIPK